MKYIFKKIKTLLIMGLLLSYSSALADTKLPLFTATSNAYDGTLEVNLTVDQNSNATGFLYTLEGTDTTVALSNLSNGIVLYQMSGKNVAVLTSTKFSSIDGGPLTLTYLHDGLQNSYHKFDFAIARQGQSWIPYIMNSSGIPQNFISMYLTAKKLLGKVIGIDRITVK